MVEITVRYSGQLHCEAIHGPSGVTIETDAPTDNHGLGQAFSPTDLCATSLAVCMLTVMGISAQKNTLDLAGTRARVRKIMTPTSPRRIGCLEVDFVLPLPEDHPERPALEHAALNCPVALSLHPDIQKSISFHWSGEPVA